jgi:hypothetical protein
MMENPNNMTADEALEIVADLRAEYPDPSSDDLGDVSPVLVYVLAAEVRRLRVLLRHAG